MELRCVKCNTYLGEMNKGKIKKDAVILCSECMETYKLFESLANYQKGVDSNKGFDGSMPDFMKEFFGGKKVV